MLVFSNELGFRNGGLITRFERSGMVPSSESDKQLWEALLKTRVVDVFGDDERIEETDVIQLSSNDISEIANTRFSRPTVIYGINWKKVAEAIIIDGLQTAGKHPPDFLILLAVPLADEVEA